MPLLIFMATLPVLVELSRTAKYQASQSLSSLGHRYLDSFEHRGNFHAMIFGGIRKHFPIEFSVKLEQPRDILCGTVVKWSISDLDVSVHWLRKSGQCVFIAKPISPLPGTSLAQPVPTPTEVNHYEVVQDNRAPVGGQ